MRTQTARAAIVLFDARVFDTAEIASILNQTEPVIDRFLSAVREMRLELQDPEFLTASRRLTPELAALAEALP